MIRSRVTRSYQAGNFQFPWFIARAKTFHAEFAQAPRVVNGSTPTRDLVIATRDKRRGPTKEDWTIRVYVLVDLYEGVDRVESFARRVSAAPEVQEVHQVSGRLDVIIHLNVACLADYQQFADTYLRTDANVREHRSSFVLHTIAGQNA